MKSNRIGQSASKPRIGEGSTTERLASRPDEDTVCSATKVAVNTKDCTGYTGEASSGKIRFGNSFITEDCSIVFTPGGAYGGPSKVTGETEWRVYGYNPINETTRYAGAYTTLYSGSNTGSIKYISTETGQVLKSSTSSATSYFIAGEGGEVTPTYSDPITVLMHE